MDIDTILEAVYKKHFNLFLSIGCKYRFDAKTAEDMIHSAFVRALKNKQNIKADDEAGVRNYIVAIYRNLCLDHLSSKAFTSACREKHGEEYAVDATCNPLHVILLVEEIRSRKKVIENLQPQRYREPVRLYFEGYNRTEIADMVGRSLGSTKNMIFRGLKKFKKMINKTEQ